MRNNLPILTCVLFASMFSINALTEWDRFSNLRSFKLYYRSFTCKFTICVEKNLADASVQHWNHKVHIYTEYHSVCPLVGIGTLLPHLSPASVPLPRYQRGGSLACGWGVEGVPITTTGEKAEHSAYSVHWNICKVIKMFVKKTHIFSAKTQKHLWFPSFNKSIVNYLNNKVEHYYHTNISVLDIQYRVTECDHKTWGGGGWTRAAPGPSGRGGGPSAGCW